jgi:zeta-carotene isomerase
VKGRTSIVPFQANYWREFVRLPYFVIAAFTMGTYWAHPLMQRASYWLKW